MRIEFGSYQTTEESRKHVLECLDNNWITMGEKTRQFESGFAKVFNYPHCKLLSSGTSANTACVLSLYEINSRWGDVNEVICPGLSFIASATSIIAAGMRPVFVDVGFDLLIDVKKIEERINKNTRAIMVVGLMGKLPSMWRIADIGKKYNLPIILDGCESYGATFNGKYGLEYADFETTSHYSAHIIPISEGGCVFTKNKVNDDLIDSIRSHGRKPRSLYFDHSVFGLNFKPTDLAAAIGLGEIPYFWENFNKRKSNLAFFLDNLQGYDDIVRMNGDISEDAPHGLNFLFLKDGLYPKFLEQMEKASIHVKRTFGAIDLHGAFQKMGYRGECPIARYIGNNSGHMGVHIGLTEDDRWYVVNTVRKILDSLK